MFVFLHIPKTAGSTLKYVIENQHTRRWSRRLHYGSMSEEGRWHPQQVARAVLELPPHQQKATQVLYGHFHFGVDRYLPQPVTYYTILRDPVERLISYYYYMLYHHHYLLSRHPEQQRFQQGGVSIEEYVSSGSFPDLDNGQTRQMAGEAGLPDHTPFGRCTGALLDEAKHNLRERIQVVGLTERFDESLLLIQRLCGWKTPYYVKQNVMNQRPCQAEIPPAALAAIQHSTMFDQQLYEYGVQLFQERVAEQGPRFADQVRRFRERNRRYARLNSRWRSVTDHLRRGARLASDRLRVQESMRQVQTGVAAPLDNRR